MKNEILIREYEPGDASLVCYLQMKLYREKYGFKAIFEYYLMHAMAEFLRDPHGGQIWVSKCDDKLIGSVAIVKVNEKAAQLRWFAVDESAQGSGIGGKLLDTALKFSDESGYETINLWTIDMLHAARHMYAKRGFELIRTQENSEWSDKKLIEEEWQRKNPFKF
ncbi:GNAT family N-acetyltransferase [Campylobacter curvus]|uniref:GNAT family N-acetyltransferase n=1 Tax=Campylobacter curvus TaxID=200 RepID=UPI00146FE767|nr:GNAT family N-acetyltransferase [Campylobacter curvus]